jgi:SSS family solute:Na+ symporter
LTGFILGTIRLVLEINNKITPLENEFLRFVASVNFLHYAIILFVISISVLVIVSLLTEKPSERQLKVLIVDRNTISEKNKWRIVNIVMSFVLVIVLFSLWWIFR